jgi:hypothetical protein
LEIRSGLVIFTNSVDGTSDILLDLARDCGQQVIRWNADLWQSYELCFDGHRFLIFDPAGRCIDLSASDTLLLWRKPFLDQMDFGNLRIAAADENQARSQIREWLHAVVSLAGLQGRLRLVDPHGDRRVPKLFQLQVACEYFVIPQSQFGISGPQNLPKSDVIVKPLGDPGVSDSRIFYTQRVDLTQLFRPFPWFFQEAVLGGHDVTCVYIFGSCHFFVCDFARENNSVDWRVEINTPLQSKWKPLQHSKIMEWEIATQGLMSRLGLHYGRLDFILRENELLFLECNSNGQFGWLDDADSLNLHREFFLALFSEDAAVKI